MKLSFCFLRLTQILLLVSFYSPLFGDRAITIFVGERSVHGCETAPLVATAEEKRACNI